MAAGLLTVSREMARIEELLRSFIPVRSWVALASFVVGVLITVYAFWVHSLGLAILGAPFLAGGLLVLLFPLPYPR